MFLVRVNDIGNEAYTNFEDIIDLDRYTITYHATLIRLKKYDGASDDNFCRLLIIGLKPKYRFIKSVAELKIRLDIEGVHKSWNVG